MSKSSACDRKAFLGEAFLGEGLTIINSSGQWQSSAARPRVLISDSKSNILYSVYIFSSPTAYQAEKN